MHPTKRYIDMYTSVYKYDLFVQDSSFPQDNSSTFQGKSVELPFESMANIADPLTLPTREWILPLAGGGAEP